MKNAKCQEFFVFKSNFLREFKRPSKPLFIVNGFNHHWFQIQIVQ